jgi:hypothetical protein
MQEDGIREEGRCRTGEPYVKQGDEYFSLTTCLEPSSRIIMLPGPKSGLGVLGRLSAARCYTKILKNHKEEVIITDEKLSQRTLV